MIIIIIIIILVNGFVVLLITNGKMDVESHATGVSGDQHRRRYDAFPMAGNNCALMTRHNNKLILINVPMIMGTSNHDN